MSSKKDHELMDNWDSCLSLVKQSSAKGISAQDLAKKLGKHRTTIHSYLTSLELRGQVESKHGLWFPKETVENITNPIEKSIEKEIIIKLPLPKSDVNRMILLDNAAEHFASQR
jgi:biotin operon repressor